MRSYSVLAWAMLLATLPLAGCTSDAHGLILAPVGPPGYQPTAGADGALLVFSAYDQSANFNSLPYRRVHSDYAILAEDGKLLQNVHNDNGTSVQGPKEVRLPTGRYNVVARANGYGEVTVPMVIGANQITPVHLEGGNQWGSKAPSAQANPVRLPNGEIIGWRADVPRASQTASPPPPGYHHETISVFSDGETKFLQLVPDKDP